MARGEMWRAGVTDGEIQFNLLFATGSFFLAWIIARSGAHAEFLIWPGVRVYVDCPESATRFWIDGSVGNCVLATDVVRD